MSFSYFSWAWDNGITVRRQKMTQPSINYPAHCAVAEHRLSGHRRLETLVTWGHLQLVTSLS